MARSGTALAGAWMVLAMLTASACQQLNEALNDRDLECIEVPDDICAKLADHIVDRWWPPALIAEHGPIVRVVVQPIDCVDFEQRAPAVLRCWQALASTAPRPDGSDPTAAGEPYYQNRDGILFDYDHRVIGTFAVE